MDLSRNSFDPKCSKSCISPATSWTCRHIQGMVSKIMFRFHRALTQKSFFAAEDYMTAQPPRPKAPHLEILCDQSIRHRLQKVSIKCFAGLELATLLFGAQENQAMTWARHFSSAFCGLWCRVQRMRVFLCLFISPPQHLPVLPPCQPCHHKKIYTVFGKKTRAICF